MAQDGTGSSYGLGSGDQLQVVIFRQPDLSGQFSLDGEGYLALPLVGEIAAGGLTVDFLLPSSSNYKLDATDFIGPGAVAVGLAAVLAAFALNPFWWVGNETESVADGQE